MRIVHVTDCHVVAPGELVADRIDAAAALHRAIDRIEALAIPPDLVLATGDLVNDGRADQYDRLLDVLGRLDAPIVPVPGNHDDRTELRSRFEVLPAGGPDDPIDHVVTVDDVRIVCLDTTIPGHHDGDLDAGQLAWLDARLAEAGDGPTLVAQHHPPFLSGIAWMDEFPLDARGAERDVLARHRGVTAVLAGHHHRASATAVAGTIAWCAPSTSSTIDLDATAVTYTSASPGFAVHDLEPDGTLRTHVVTTDPADAWQPSWATAPGRGVAGGV